MKGTIIKFQTLCVCVEDPDKFIKNLTGMCEYYSVKGYKNQPSTDPLIQYTIIENVRIKGNRKAKVKGNS